MKVESAPGKDGVSIQLVKNSYSYFKSFVKVIKNKLFITELPRR